jgi:hypothetical protein
MAKGAWSHDVLLYCSGAMLQKITLDWARLGQAGKACCTNTVLVRNIT